MFFLGLSEYGAPEYTLLSTNRSIGTIKASYTKIYQFIYKLIPITNTNLLYFKVASTELKKKLNYYVVKCNILKLRFTKQIFLKQKILNLLVCLKQINLRILNIFKSKGFFSHILNGFIRHFLSYLLVYTHGAPLVRLGGSWGAPVIKTTSSVVDVVICGELDGDESLD